MTPRSIKANTLKFVFKVLKMWSIILSVNYGRNGFIKSAPGDLRRALLRQLRAEGASHRVREELQHR
jgi:hypothetical protein